MAEDLESLRWNDSTASARRPRNLDIQGAMAVFSLSESLVTGFLAESQLVQGVARAYCGWVLAHGIRFRYKNIKAASGRLEVLC
jgi:hypothetical protein